MNGEPSHRIYLLFVVLFLILNSCAGQLQSTADSSSTRVAATSAAVSVNTPEETELKPPGTMEYISGTVIVPGLGAYSPTGASADQGILVNQVIPGSGAEGILLRGDIIKAINEEFIVSWESYYAILGRYFGGQYVTAWIIRDDQKMTVRFALSRQTFQTDHDAVLQILAEELPVRLAVIPGKLELLGDYSEEENNTWKIGAEQMLLATTESAWSTNLRGLKRFSIIDRRNIEMLMEEQGLSLTGLVEDGVRLGKIAGATHVLEVSATVEPDNTAESGEHVNYFNRLLDVETGIVVASVVYRVY